MKDLSLNRRTMLRGIGAAIGLPLLEAMMPVGKTAFAESARPARFLAYFTPNGLIMNQFVMPVGPIANLSPTLASFELLKKNITQVRGLTTTSNVNGGQEAVGTQAYLRPAGEPISVDQVAHQAHMANANATRFGSLALGVDGSCTAVDQSSPQYLCAISWESRQQIKPKDSDPQLLFDKLFSNFDFAQSQQATLARKARDESVLSAVKGDVKNLQKKLGATDKQILEKYFSSIEDLEQNINQLPAEKAGCQKRDRPAVPISRDQIGKLLSDLAILAFQCDLVRYQSFMLENGGSAVAHTELGVSSGHYNLMLESDIPSLLKIERWMMGQFAYLVSGLDAAKDISGASLLDSCVVTMSNELSSGTAFSHTNMPFLIAGSCNGYFKMGQTIQSDGNFGDMWVTVLDALGFPTPKFGNSTRKLLEIMA